MIVLKSKKYVRTITSIPDDLWNEIKNILPDEKLENTALLRNSLFLTYLANLF